MSEQVGTAADIAAEIRRLVKWAQANGELLDLQKSSGNAAKMREALEFASIVLAKWRQDAPFSAWNEYGEVIDRCRAALSATPRNCDVGTAEEQERRLLEYCRKYRNKQAGTCLACPLLGLTISGICGLPWAQMPYNESEAAK